MLRKSVFTILFSVLSVLKNFSIRDMVIRENIFLNACKEISQKALTVAKDRVSS